VDNDVVYLASAPHGHGQRSLDQFSIVFFVHRPTNHPVTSWRTIPDTQQIKAQLKLILRNMRNNMIRNL
jgi:hypothetical protein